MRVASWVASLSLVWPWNSGSRMNTESMAAAVPSTSSAVIWPARRLPTRSPKSRRALPSAERKPFSCVPPSGVGMVLQ